MNRIIYYGEHVKEIWKFKLASLWSETSNLWPLYVAKGRGAFTNYVYKRRGVGGQKNRLFVNFYTIENVNGGG